jgi:hypothetical protein
VCGIHRNHILRFMWEMHRHLDFYGKFRSTKFRLNKISISQPPGKLHSTLDLHKVGNPKICINQYFANFI